MRRCPNDLKGNSFPTILKTNKDKTFTLSIIRVKGIWFIKNITPHIPEVITDDPKPDQGTKPEGGAGPEGDTGSVGQPRTEEGTKPETQPVDIIPTAQNTILTIKSIRHWRDPVQLLYSFTLALQSQSILPADAQILISRNASCNSTTTLPPAELFDPAKGYTYRNLASGGSAILYYKVTFSGNTGPCRALERIFSPYAPISTADSLCIPIVSDDGSQISCTIPNWLKSSAEGWLKELSFYYSPDGCPPEAQVITFSGQNLLLQPVPLRLNRPPSDFATRVYMKVTPQQGEPLCGFLSTFPKKSSANPSILGVVVTAAPNGTGLTVQVTREGSYATKVYRRRFEESTFTVAKVLSPSDPDTFIDIVPSGNYEYYAENTLNTSERRLLSYTPVAHSAGIGRVPESRGIIAVVVEQGLTPLIQAELDQYQANLIGDGWEVQKIEAPRFEEFWWGQYGPSYSTEWFKQNNAQNITNMLALKATLKDRWIATQGRLKALVLIGHVVMPWSGTFTIDGHSDNGGASPSDLFYGDFTGVWTDNTPNPSNQILESAYNLFHRNVAQDGKFTEDYVPGKLSLQIGRIDFYGLSVDAEYPATLYTPALALPIEARQIKRYLKKNNAYRHRQFFAERGALRAVGVGFPVGFHEHQPDARKLYPRESTLTLDGQPWNDTDKQLSAIKEPLRAHSYQWVIGRGYGSPDWCKGIVSFDQFKDPTAGARAIFWNLFGSYFGRANHQNHLLRAALISPTENPVASGHWGLASFYNQNWLLHRLNLGDTIGNANVLTVNDASTFVVEGFRSQSRSVELKTSNVLYGDPTLRIHTLPSPLHVTISRSAGGSTVCWDPPAQEATEIDGYAIYASALSTGPFRRIHSGIAPKGQRCLTDTLTPSASTLIYMVKSVKTVTTSSGSYLNEGQGVIGQIH